MTTQEQMLFDLATEVKRMRELQKEYFKNRDKFILQTSKQKERLIDSMVEEIIVNLKDK